MNKRNGADYAAVLADLQRQRARLDAAIHALEAVLPDRSATETPAATGAAGPVEPASEPAVFDGLTVYEAAVRYLQGKGEGQRTTQILRALQQGGVALTGKSPINSLGAILNDKLKHNSRIVKLERGRWGLAAWQAPPRRGKAAPSKAATKHLEPE